MRKISTLLLLGLTMWSGGCRSGPDGQFVNETLQERLDQRFGEDLFEVSKLTRRGHYPFTADDDSQRVLVYYDAELSFQRDHALSDWDQLNVGSLISVLGATPQGVEGVKAEGNRSGDLLLVHGALAFAESWDGWKTAPFTGAGAKRAEPAPSDKRDLPYRQRLERLSKLGQRLHRKGVETDQQFLTDAIEDVAAAAERRLGRIEGLLTIVTGSKRGEYFRQGNRLAEVLTDAGTESRAFATKGSIENCRLVDANEVTIAYAQNDIAYMAYHGTGLFKGQLPLRNLRALASLYPEAVQVVTLRKSGIVSLGDLRGKRVDVGVDGSGSRINAIEVLDAAGLNLGDLGLAQGKEPSGALDDLRAGRVDAVVLTSAFPMPVVAELAEEVAISLVPLGEDHLATLVEGSPFLISMQLPEQTYHGMDHPVATVGVTATLVTHARTKNASVQLVLEQLFANVARLSEGSPNAYLISAKRARTGLSIPLHPAADKVLEAAR